eukprot:5119424-Pleurochrysis_carterae.AAC.1
MSSWLQVIMPPPAASTSIPDGAFTQCTTDSDTSASSGQPQLGPDQFYVRVVQANGKEEMCVASYNLIPSMEVNSVAVSASAAAEKSKEVQHGEEVDDPDLAQVLLRFQHSAKSLSQALLDIH